MYYNFFQTHKQFVSKFFEPSEAFEKGNIQKAIYESYDDIEPVNFKNIQEDKYKELQKWIFVKTDLKIYLDVHPDDLEAKALYEESCRNVSTLMENLEKETDNKRIKGVDKNVVL